MRIPKNNFYYSDAYFEVVLFPSTAPFFNLHCTHERTAIDTIMSRAVRLQLMISCEDLPRISVMPKKLPNAVAIVARLTEIGSVLGIQRHRIGVTEMYVSAMP